MKTWVFGFVPFVWIFDLLIDLSLVGAKPYFLCLCSTNLPELRHLVKLVVDYYWHPLISISNHPPVVYMNLHHVFFFSTSTVENFITLGKFVPYSFFLNSLTLSLTLMYFYIVSTISLPIQSACALVNARAKWLIRNSSTCFAFTVELCTFKVCERTS